jgi:hypothetical protein
MSRKDNDAVDKAIDEAIQAVKDKMDAAKTSVDQLAEVIDRQNQKWKDETDDKENKS